MFPTLKKMRRLPVLLSVAAAVASAPATAGFDHRPAPDGGGIYRHYNQVSAAVFLTSLGGALYLGTEDRLGRTFWQNTEGYFVDQAANELIKRATGRLRPAETDDPGLWRKGGRSFPSGHVSSMAAMVTPLILEYGGEKPAVWALAILPAYEMVARVKQRAHWQSDVIAGAALGVAVGYAEHARGPFILRVIPGGVFVGFQKSLR